MSSQPDVLNDIPKEKLLSQNIKRGFNSEITERQWELSWEEKKYDKLTFQHSPENLPNTKQSILSLVTSIFKPL